MAGPRASVIRISTRALLAQLLILQLLIGSALGRRFDSIDNCRARVIDANATTPSLNLTFMLTLPQCYEYCGTGYGTCNTWSVISTLTSWVIPLFLLLHNVTYARISSPVFKIGKFSLGTWGNRIAVISHLLANPIDFLWSLTLKLDVGHRLKKRCDRILSDDEEKKDLSSICFALEDFGYGKHVDTLLKTLEDDSSHFVHHKAIYDILGPTAFDLAGARNQNKLHSTLAILIYGKEVFEALINAKLDGTFPYHMPHTLALRQIYYWLFLAVILSSATGGFANQWTSHIILKRFLAQRRAALKSEMKKLPGGQEDPQWPKLWESIYGNAKIILRPLEPWNGGNYSWRYPEDDVSERHLKNDGSERNLFLPIVVVTAVALPVVSAFLISWFVPMVGLGARGIMELSFPGLWLFNWALTQVVGIYWKGRGLFRIMWWNLFWSLASLIVLFSAFQGWFNSCESWAAYYSRGATGAFLNLNMKVIEENDIFKFYLPMVIAALGMQLSLAASILIPNIDILECIVWDDKESRDFLHRRRTAEFPNCLAALPCGREEVLDSLAPQQVAHKIERDGSRLNLQGSLAEHVGYTQLPNGVNAVTE